MSNQNLRNFTVFNVDLKSNNRPRSRRSSGVDIISKDTGILHGSAVLIIDLLNLQVLTFIVPVLLIFIMFSYILCLYVCSSCILLYVLAPYCNWPLGCCVSSLKLKNLNVYTMKIQKHK